MTATYAPAALLDLNGLVATLGLRAAQRILAAFDGLTVTWSSSDGEPITGTLAVGSYRTHYTGEEGFTVNVTGEWGGDFMAAGIWADPEKGVDPAGCLAGNPALILH